MSFPINTTIPNGPNDPADDVPLMRQNYANINSYLTVDHVAPGAGGNGFHKQITYASFNPPGASPTDPTGIAFTAPGLANAAAPQNYFINSNTTIPMSAVRAFGVFLTTTGTTIPTFLNSWNLTCTNKIATPATYDITITSGAVVNNNTTVLITASNGTTIIYGFLGTGVFRMVPTSQSAGVAINIIVLQV